MIERSIEGSARKKSSMLLQVIENDEPRANEWEIELDELCTNLIARYEPKAKDLRTILMVLKMTNDLERMGDHAVNISQAGLYLLEQPQLGPSALIPTMAEATTKMVADGVDSFVNEDPELARKVCERDSQVDTLRDQLLRELIKLMTSDSTVVGRALQTIRISSNLERIADLSTNICEDVVFMVKGRVIKHHAEEVEADSGENVP
jgi:phosphate transport system protein